MLVISLIVGMAKQISWRIALPIIVAVAALGYAYYKGYAEADAKWQAKQQAEIAAEVVKAHKAEIVAEGIANGLQMQNETLAKKVTDYETIIAKAPKGDVCRLSASDLKRLRGLREQRTD